jgi:AraC-like DNA-binding protein
MHFSMPFAKSRDFNSIPTATGGIARLACARLEEMGKDPTVVLSKVGLTAEDARDPATRLEVRTQIKFLELAAEEAQDEWLGFHLACNYDLREIGLVYYVIASSHQLADALRNAERYSQINNEGVRLRFSLKGGIASIALEYIDVDRRADRHQIEFWLVTLLRICRQVTNCPLTPLRLKTQHFRNRTPTEFKAFFGIDIEFGANTDEISFSQPVAPLSVVGRDEYLNKMLRSYAEEALARKPQKLLTVRSKAEDILCQSLPHGKPTATEVARQLGMSSRTFSRKLSQEGASFEEIVDQLRAALAKRYLRDERLRISTIAWLLGYREIGSLTHAFKRWTGMTPREFRSRLSGAMPDPSKLE